MLTAAKIRRTSKPGMHTDGPGRHGLFLVVKEGARGLRKTFSQRVTIAGKRTMIGLGKVEFVTLAEARTMAFENARSLARGGALVHGGQRRAGAAVARVVPTFAEAADAYIKLQAAGWKANSRTEGNWRSSLVRAAPIAAVKVDAVDGDAVVGIVRKLVDGDMAPTAKALAQRIKAILGWAIDEGHRTGPNPVNGRVDRELARGRRRTKHHDSVAVEDVSGVYAAAASITDPRWQGLTGAFRLAILTACRTTEVLGARWSEVDLAARTWTIPEGRMKGKREHRVPLSDEAIVVLEAARQRTGGKGLVFLSPSRKAIGDDGLRRVMKRIGVNATVHGFRGSFKTWAMESGISRDVAEFSVAHRSHMSDVEASYVWTDLLEKRRPVMERWGRHVAGSEAPKVVAISGGGGVMAPRRQRRVSVKGAREAVRQFFRYHAEALASQHRALVEAGVSAKVRRNRYELFMCWIETESHDLARKEFESEVLEDAKVCREAWHAAMMIGIAKGEYRRRERGSIDDYTILTGWWWDVGWCEVVENIGPYPPGPGRGTPSMDSRGHLICDAMAGLIRAGFTGTRNEVKRSDAGETHAGGESDEEEEVPAAAIVSDALDDVYAELDRTGFLPKRRKGKSKHLVGEGRVGEIWTDFKKEWGDDTLTGRDRIRSGFEWIMEGYPVQLFNELPQVDSDSETDPDGQPLKPLSEWGRELVRLRIEQQQHRSGPTGDDGDPGD